MTYFVCDLNDLRERGKDAGTDDRETIEKALNNMEAEGMTLAHIFPQYLKWDDEGSSQGKNEALFIFHKADSTAP